VTDKPPVRSVSRQKAKRRAEAVRRAIRHVRALPPVAEAPPDPVRFDYNAWADRWHLHALLDLAPFLRSYSQRRPADGARFAPGPRVVPLRGTISIELDADRDTKAAKEPQVRDAIVEQYPIGETAIVHDGQRVSTHLELSTLTLPPLHQFRYLEVKGGGTLDHEVFSFSGFEALTVRTGSIKIEVVGRRH
jgi:hypothetical protein